MIAINTTSATTASLLLANSRTARRQPLETTCTSPPSGISSCSPPLGAGSASAARPRSSICWEGVSGSVKANPGVGGGDGDVGE